MHQGLFLECATRMQDGVTVASVTISEINFCSSKLREILKFVERAFLFKVEQGGLMDQWNAKHSPQITPGAEIRAINGSWNPLQMLEERDAKSHTIWIYMNHPGTEDAFLNFLFVLYAQELRHAKPLKFDIWKPRSKRAEVSLANDSVSVFLNLTTDWIKYHKEWQPSSFYSCGSGKEANSWCCGRFTDWIQQLNWLCAFL